MRRSFAMALVQAAVLAVSLLQVTSAPRAELPPQAYQRWQREAPEALVIEVVDVQVGAATAERPDDLGVTVRARVIEAERSASRLAPGALIRIEYATRRPGGPAIVGPSSVPILSRGARYPAFLARKDKGDAYVPAAGGRSFERLRE
jgi:hypothetical protein